MDKKIINLTEFKASDTENGGFSGYANNFGVLDSYNDITLSGCFQDSLSEFIECGFSASDHRWGVTSEIGIIKSAMEDTTGLLTEIAFHPTADAQTIRQKLNNRITNNKKTCLSIGFSIEQGGYKYIRGEEAVPFLKNPSEEVLQYLKESEPIIRLLTKVKLYEVSLVSVGANPESQVVNAKSAQIERRKAFHGTTNAKQIALLNLKLRSISVGVN